MSLTICDEAITTCKVSLVHTVHSAKFGFYRFPEVEIKPEMFVTWPRGDGVIIICKGRSVHAGLPS